VLPHDFKIIIFFDDFCDICKSESTEIEIREVLNQHDFPDRKRSEQVLKGTDPELEEKHLKTNLQFNPELYRYWSEEEIKKAELF
jgi:hypothetical protein